MRLPVVRVPFRQALVPRKRTVRFCMPVRISAEDQKADMSRMRWIQKPV